MREAGIEISNGKQVIATIPNKEEEFDLETLSEYMIELRRRSGAESDVSLVHLARLAAKAEVLQSEAKTAMWLAVDGQASAIIGVADTIKEGSKNAVEQMHELGLTVIMMTGDNEATAQSIAAEVGIDRVFAEVLPGDKSGYVATLQDEGYFVGMVGDGINDAPALAKADVGIAMGTGIDVAVESGDIVLMKGELGGVLTALALSRATMRNIRQNLFWAYFYNTFAIPVAFLGLLHPVIAEGAMALSSITVVTNANRLRSVRLDR